MKEIYRGKDRTKKEFIVTTSTRNLEDRLHLIVNTGEKKIDYTFFCNDIYNHQTEWNVTRCKAVLKAIENEKIKVKKTKVKKERLFIVGIFCKDGKEYFWRVPFKFHGQIKEGMWVKVGTKHGIGTVKVVKVLPAKEVGFEPTHTVRAVMTSQNFELLTMEEKLARLKLKKAQKKAKTE